MSTFSTLRFTGHSAAVAGIGSLETRLGLDSGDGLEAHF